MNKKYQKYIEYIVNDIKPPYFHNMEDHYGLKDNEYPLVLSKLYEQPVTIKGNNVYDINGNIIYYEYDNGDWRKYGYDDNDNEIYYETSDGDGDWIKYEYDINGNNIYSENSDGDWYKYEYDDNGNRIYFENSNGTWYKYGYDSNGNNIYYEDSDGYIIDNR
jgi:hypothetical protein